jgi:hypothetical protein
LLELEAHQDLSQGHTIPCPNPCSAQVA